MNLLRACHLITGAESSSDESERDAAGLRVLDELRRHAAWHLGDSDHVHDLAMEVFARLMGRRALVERPSAFLAAAVYHTLIDQWRRESREHRGLVGFGEALTSPAIEEAEDQSDVTSLSASGDEEVGWQLLAARALPALGAGDEWTRWQLTHNAAAALVPETWADTPVRLMLSLRHATAVELLVLLGAASVPVGGVEPLIESIHARLRLVLEQRLPSETTEAASEHTRAFRPNAFAELCARRGRDTVGRIVGGAARQSAWMQALVIRHAVARELPALVEALRRGEPVDSDGAWRQVQNRFANRHRHTLVSVRDIVDNAMRDVALTVRERRAIAAAAAALHRERTRQKLEFGRFTALLETAETAS